MKCTFKMGLDVLPIKVKVWKYISPYICAIMKCPIEMGN